VFCSFLALLLKAELERRIKFADLEREWAQVLRGLEALQRCSVAAGRSHFSAKALSVAQSANQRGFSGFAGHWSRRTTHLTRAAVIRWVAGNVVPKALSKTGLRQSFISGVFAYFSSSKFFLTRFFSNS
jgi:hypothetical protein